MNKKKLSFIIILVVLLSSFIFIDASSFENIFLNLGRNNKAALENSKASGTYKENDIMLNSKLIIKNELLVEEINLLSVNSSYEGKELAEKAVNEVIQQTVMTSYAESLGYEVSEKDFDIYKKSLVSSIQEADNYDEMLKYFEGFGGIDEYFKCMEHRLKNNLLVRKYLDDEMVQYAKAKGYDIHDSEFIEIWRQKENEIIEEQVSKNNISSSQKNELVHYALDYISNEIK